MENNFRWLKFRIISGKALSEFSGQVGIFYEKEQLC